MVPPGIQPESIGAPPRAVFTLRTDNRIRTFASHSNRSRIVTGGYSGTVADAPRRRPELADYDAKRDFDQTAEPRGGDVRASRSGRLFVVQKHAARNLHYDLRLEFDGVLKSWAVPKGPSLDPAQKPLAVHTEDHPLEYANFEGVIPKGAYGGGTVMVWDIGDWEPIGDPVEGYERGDLKFRLRGEKLRGAWVLARMSGRQGEGGKNCS